MKTTTKVLAGVLALGSAATLSGTASAHDWQGGWGYHQPWGGGWGGWRDDRGNYGGTCSGQRGYRLERQLRWQFNRGRIDGWTAQRIQREIDRLQWKEQHECGEGDWRAVGKINRDYDRIGDWIAREAGGYWDR